MYYSILHTFVPHSNISNAPITSAVVLSLCSVQLFYAGVDFSSDSMP